MEANGKQQQEHRIATILTFMKCHEIQLFAYYKPESTAILRVYEFECNSENIRDGSWIKHFSLHG